MYKVKKKIRYYAIPEFLYICTTTETNMEAKVHFLAIPAQEFSKILTDPRHQYLSDLLKLHQWHHREYYKFIVPNENPVEIRDLLDRMDIRYFYTVIPFQFHCNILTPFI